MPNRPFALTPAPRIPLNEKIAWSVKDVVDSTGLSETYVKVLTNEGTFRAVKCGKRKLYDPRQVQEALFGQSA